MGTAIPRHPAIAPAALALLVLSTMSLAAGSVRASLASYVNKPDKNYAWKLSREFPLSDGGSASILRLTSQQWRGIVWKHWLSVFRPARVAHPEHALLVISGGNNRSSPPSRLSSEARLLAQIARKTGSVVAVLSQVPNQPLIDGLREDALISYTFEKFLKTGDSTWPCLLPMTKSAVRAMDAVQALVKEKHSQEIRRFVVTGASKRGWTTWLTGAVDPRVCAIAPMVIDVLNMPAQMPHQVECFGGYSEKIHDYTNRGLASALSDPRSKPLIRMVDPYSFREKLAMPKLILLGTNDRYWPVDAANLYFGDLPGEKHLHYVPNRGHGLGPTAVVAITAFYDLVINGKKRPVFRWRYARGKERTTLSIDAEDSPVEVELWKAVSKKRDFRDARWSSSPVARKTDGRYVASIPPPQEGYSAVFGQLTYKSPLGVAYTLSTSVEVIAAK